MDIRVDRHRPDDASLVFTITVTNPHTCPYDENDILIIKLLDGCKKEISDMKLNTGETSKDALGLIDEVKHKLFNRVLHNLRFSIENDLRSKFRPICQEIYNWIQDMQIGDLKTWMLEVDPQRTTYYFDNDQNAHKNPSDQESEHEEEDDE